MKNFKAETVQSKLVSALESRIATAPNENQADNLRAELKKFSGADKLYIFEAAKAYEIDLVSLAEKIALTQEQSKDNFVAVYALQKIRKALYAFAATAANASFFDGYSKSIITNLVRLQTLNGVSTRAVLSRAVEYSETDQTQDIKRLHNCAQSTASTQASSTRMMLHYLDVCNVVKRAQGDCISFKESKAATKMQEWFAVK